MPMKLLLSVFWLIIIPIGVGMNFTVGRKEKNTLGNAYIFGYMGLFAMSELLILPVIFWWKLSLCRLALIWGVWAAVLAGVGIWRNRRDLPLLPARYRAARKEFSLYLLLAIAVIGAQMVISVLGAHYDADDSFYVAAACTDVQTDTVFAVDPYTGSPYDSLPLRYVLSPFPVFNSIVSTLCAGLHPAIMAHVIFPAVFLLAAYTVYYQLGKSLFPQDKKAPALFVLFLALIQMCSNFTVYTSGTFMLVRIWQGKAFLAAMILPLIYYVCLEIKEKKDTGLPWLLLGCITAAGCFVSTMGVMLCPIAVGILAVVRGVFRRKWLWALKACLCCLPSLVVAGIYLILWMGG